MEKVALDVRFLTPFYFGTLFLPFEQQKKVILFAFCSFIRTSELCSKVLSLENKKKNLLFLCILLVYSYLCAVKKNERWTKK
jgi:hypothetical protein